MKKQTEIVGIKGRQGETSDAQPKGRKPLRLHRETLRTLTDQDLRAVGGASAACGTNPTWVGCIYSAGTNCTG